MPLPEVVVSGVFVSGFREEPSKRSKDLPRRAHEGSERTTLSLNCNVPDDKSIIRDMLSHEDAPNLPRPRILEGFGESPGNINRDLYQNRLVRGYQG